MNYKEHRATMQHAARYVKQCEKRLALALDSGEEAPLIIATMQDNLDRALCEQTILRNTKLSELA